MDPVEKILQTPESRFCNLKDYPFQPHFLKVGSLRMHYIEEGPSYAEPVLLLHGVPAWSYLYRHIISKLAGTGCHVFAPDLIGFGKSDKPSAAENHSYRFHIEAVTEFILKLGLKDILLFAHDWGSLIGLRVLACHPDLFSGIIISNGMLPVGEHKLHPGFRIWKLVSRYLPFIPASFIIESGTERKLDDEERKAYNAPFPSAKYKAAIKAMPSQVPTSRDDPESEENRSAWSLLGAWTKPFLTLFSNGDPITRGADEYIQCRIPGAAGQDHKRLDAGHFIQEDRGTEIADIIIRFRNKLLTD
ncbi:MAG: haloalkane dehalogenase [Bacteroidota bacterium]